MRYFKWQSEDQQYLVEKFKGTFTSDFIELSEKYLLNYNKDSMVLYLLSDISEASFSPLNPFDAIEIGNNFLKSIPPTLNVKFSLILGAASRHDDLLIKMYCQQIEKDHRVTFMTHPSLEEACEGLQLTKDITTQIIEEANSWG